VIGDRSHTPAFSRSQAPLGNAVSQALLAGDLRGIGKQSFQDLGSQAELRNQNKLWMLGFVPQPSLRAKELLENQSNNCYWTIMKILVIGCGGAGKSTFSRRLGEKLGLPVFHLDAYFWKSGWVESEHDEFAEVIDKISQQPRWIMDGNYGRTLDQRIEFCETVIFLDIPRTLCLWRVIKRTIQFRGKTRPDMGKDCPERFNLDFIRYVWNYPVTRRIKLLSKLDAIKSHRQVFVLENEKQINEFLINPTRKCSSNPF